MSKRTVRQCDICFEDMSKDLARGGIKIFYIAKINRFGSYKSADICGECLRRIVSKIEERSKDDTV